MILTIITVGTNEKHWLEPCLRSVFAMTSGIEFEMVVIDNASTDGTGEFLEREYPQVRVIRNNTNMGFAAANNKGIKLARGKYILLLNPDTQIVDGAIQKTVAFMDSHPRAGLLGCRLLYPDGRTQPTTYAFPRVWNMLSETLFLYRIFPRTRLFGGYHLTYLSHDDDVQVDWLIGAYFLFRREIVETVGLLDEQFYMYTEDTDYCYRVKKAGYEVWFTPKGEITHFYGGYSGFNKNVAVWTHRSQMLFYQKHYGPLSRVMLTGIKLLGLLLRIPWYLIRGIIEWNSMEFRKSYVAAYSIYKIATTRWKYIPGFEGEVLPWDRA